VPTMTSDEIATARPFMGADQLDAERISACVLSVATAGGPILKCLHNAQRGGFILRPLQVGRETWGLMADTPQPARRVKLRHRA